MARFGLYLPNVGFEGLLQPSQIASYAQQAEELGFESLWVEDRLLHELPILDALTMLSFVSSVTKTARLGTCVLLANFRNPITLARSICSLYYLSGGRLVIGASLGGRVNEYPAGGLDIKNRARRFNETIRIVKLLLSQDGVSLDTSLFRVRSATVNPKPTRSVPILIGGSSEKALKRAGTIGDGWLAGSLTDPQSFAAGWAKVIAHAREAGRSVSGLEAAKFTYILVDPDERSAASTLQMLLNRYYDFQYDSRRYCLYGSPERCAKGARELLEAGVQTLIFSPVRFDIGQIRLIAEGVIPLMA